MTLDVLPRFLDRTTPPHILTLVMMSGLSAAAMNIFLPSLPSMTVFFDTDYRVIQLSVSLYLAVNAVLQLFIGPISDRFGRRPVVLGSFGIFALATVGCILATSIEVFLFCRLCQAVVVAGLVLSRAIVRDIYAEAESASKIGYVTMGMALVPMVAPIFGGLLDQAFGWQANFMALLVLCFLLLVVVWNDLGETHAPVAGATTDWSALPELFTSLRFWGYTLCNMLASGAFFAYLGGAPFVGSQVFGLSPATLGFFFGAPALGYAAGNAISGAYSVRMGINWMILTGTILSSAGIAASLGLTYAGFGGVATFFGFVTFVGLGNGMVVPNATAGMLSVRPNLAGTASGIGGAMMIGGGAALSALAGVMLVPGVGEFPLLWMMLITSALAIVAILFVIRRERRLAAMPAG